MRITRKDFFKIMKAQNSLFLLFVLLIIYMVYGTGIVSDDFSEILGVHKKGSFLTALVPSGNLINIPVLQYTHIIFYHFISLDHLLLIDALKTVYITVAFYMTSKFFSIFTDKTSALFASFLFVFFPTHDATNYFYLGQYLLLCISLYLFAYYLAFKNRMIPAGIFALLASFISYGSPPIAFSLFILCLLKKSYKMGFILFIPNIVFTLYYTIVSKIMAVSVSRIPSDFNFLALIKQLVLQIGSFFDVFAGPSFFLKLYTSILANSVLSVLVLILFVAGYLKLIKSMNREETRTQPDIKLLSALIILTFASLGMFAITGYYPQLAFNLGNRTTIYGSLLISYLIIILPIPAKIHHAIFLIFLVAAVGISTHWKQWNQHQLHVIDNIRNNQELASYNKTERIYVSGNQYSKLGDVSHIEFLSEHHVVQSIFKLAGHEKLNIKTLNKRFVLENGKVFDKKYNLRYSTGKNVMVYDSDHDQLLTVPAKDLNRYINDLPEDKRHWIQFIENETINALILKLLPRLNYVL
jgi:hypothetical protein